MQAKKKICDSCSQLKYIWKNFQGERFCQQCWMKHPICIVPAKPTVKQKPISHRSPKRAKEEREYSLLRIDFLTKNHMCQAHLTGCTGIATDVHHKQGRIGKLLLDILKWLSVCRSCHNWIETHPKEAQELGFSLKRNSN